jgi:hypothetical protein
LSFKASHITLSILASVMLMTCVTDNRPVDKTIIARVGTSYLTLEHIRNSVPQSLWEADSIAAITNFRDNWISRQVLYQEALRLNFQNEPEIQSRINRSRQDILSAALQDRIILNESLELAVTMEEVQNYYEDNRDQFVLQERYLRVRHLASDNLNDSREGKSQLMRGIPWETVVERFGMNQQETLRRSNQFYPESTILNDVPPMRDYLRVIGITEVSPIRSHEGIFHWVQIVEDRPRGDHPDIDWIFEQIREWLKVEKRRRAIRIYEQNLLIQAQSNNEIDVTDVMSLE